ncbi:hypothetical protein Pcinc_037823 [Petrolisthes cinctipes]|uniref:Uncharacterized protein n=1 Tax=Petrolisthes cinctipes TaxID=88211 RepID=A0AAE1BSQ8_PETCI|nr:hypothetical protein Pcinc_037823 [Petrolisthes cinctipes]
MGWAVWAALYDRPPARLAKPRPSPPRPSYPISLWEHANSIRGILISSGVSRLPATRATTQITVSPPPLAGWLAGWLRVPQSRVCVMVSVGKKEYKTPVMDSRCGTNYTAVTRYNKHLHCHHPLPLTKVVTDQSTRVRRRVSRNCKDGGGPCEWEETGAGSIPSSQDMRDTRPLRRQLPVTSESNGAKGITPADTTISTCSDHAAPVSNICGVQVRLVSPRLQAVNNHHITSQHHNLKRVSH